MSTRKRDRGEIAVAAGLPDFGPLRRLSRKQLAALVQRLRGTPYGFLAAKILKTGDPDESPLAAEQMLMLHRQGQRDKEAA